MKFFEFGGLGCGFVGVVFGSGSVDDLLEGFGLWVVIGCVLGVVLEEKGIGFGEFGVELEGVILFVLEL